jgi:hypothetical protein
MLSRLGAIISFTAPVVDGREDGVPIVQLPALTYLIHSLLFTFHSLVPVCITIELNYLPLSIHTCPARPMTTYIVVHNTGGASASGCY